MTINIGIGPNRFLAKTAANLNKPDGLNIIDYHNLKTIYKSLKLTDLTGIASHYESRLNAANIFSPSEFLEASSETLKRLVFHGVIGEDWYLRLRGYEIDNITSQIGSVGRQFVLDIKSPDDKIIIPRFHHLCESTGRKLRFNNMSARGLLVWATFQSGDSWYTRKMFKTNFYTDKDIYQRALYLFNQRPKGLIMTSMGITCYMLKPSSRNQISLFDEINKQEWLTRAVDHLNDRYGNFTISSIDSIQTKKTIKQKIPFGSTKYFELLLQSDKKW